MKCIVGLGNPGKEYEYTRHNMGFMAIDYYAKKNNLDFKMKFNGLYSMFTMNGEKVIILKPQSYMNNSGDVVKRFIDYFKINVSDLIVIYDDINFDVGNYKIKSNGSSGGHNGINDIINKVGTSNINRIKIGIGKNNNDLIDYVLGRISNEDILKINNILPIIANVIDDFCNYDIEKIMSIYNRKE